MSGRIHSSPREEALEIALKVRRDALSGSVDPVAVLRACLLIANNLGKKDTIEWINKELSGYPVTEQLPEYRIKDCPVYNETLTFLENFEKIGIWHSVHRLLSSRTLTTKEDRIAMQIKDKDGDIILVYAQQIDEIIGAIVDRCFNFLNATISEL